jgi:hypothetical protein
MEATTVDTRPAEPVAEVTGGTAPEMGTTVALEVRVETRGDPFPRLSTGVVVCEPIIEEAAPIHSAPMSEVTSTSQLLDDYLIDPTFVARSMESWHRAEQWIKVRCEYSK